jgi:NAD(P)-dependent dehydrogenase (short-subunit alcohol dehydrogenase family)
VSDDSTPTSGPPERWAVVLGASCGTGAAIARTVSRDLGLHVFGAHRGNHAESAAAVERDVVAAGRRLHFRVGDAGTAEGAADGGKVLAELAGPRSIKLLVHSLANASVGQLALVDGDRLVPRQFQKTFDSMAHSFVWWTQELLARDLFADGALILGLSNPMVDTVVRGTSLIAASKAALEIYVRHLARELGPRGHRVNLLKFGAVMTTAVEKTFGDSLERLRAVLPQIIPAGRTSTADEVARLVAFLASDGAAWFNGATIDFTGAESQGLFDALIHPQRKEPG